MSHLFDYLRWRIFTGLAMMVVSIVIMAITGTGGKIFRGQQTGQDIELARQQREDYDAEREIRSARQAGGYDPSDPSVVRDGYSQSEESRTSYRGTEPYAEEPSE